MPDPPRALGIKSSDVPPRAGVHLIAPALPGSLKKLDHDQPEGAAADLRGSAALPDEFTGRSPVVEELFLRGRRFSIGSRIATGTVDLQVTHNSDLRKRLDPRPSAAS